jgi:hypothetical protein
MMKRYLVGAGLGVAAYVVYQKARGNGGGLTSGLIQLADPKFYAAVLVGALLAHGGL